MFWGDFEVDFNSIDQSSASPLNIFQIERLQLLSYTEVSKIRLYGKKNKYARFRSPNAKADFKGMLKELLTGYGIKELDFIRKALSPKLQCLGVLALIPSLDERAPPGGGKVSPTLAEEGDALEKEVINRAHLLA